VSFLTFMSSGSGRLTRIAAGSALIVAGALLRGGWLALVVVGAVPLAAGVFDFGPFAPLARRPFRGADLRRTTHP
jgi:hypothetical protein